jgi:hypothetical protein
MGGASGTQMSGERCAECGDCLLDRTGGVCPITACSKSMVNGPCGGTTSDGKCEVDRKRPCGWHRIYQRLKDLQALGQIKEIVPAKRYGLFLPSYERMTGTFWAVEGRPGLVLRSDPASPCVAGFAEQGATSQSSKGGSHE